MKIMISLLLLAVMAMANIAQDVMAKQGCCVDNGRMATEVGTQMMCWKRADAISLAIVAADGRKVGIMVSTEEPVPWEVLPPVLFVFVVVML